MALPDLMDTIKFSNIPEFVAHIDKLIAGTKPTPDVTRITTNGKMERRHRTPQLKTVQMSILLFLCATSFTLSLPMCSLLGRHHGNKTTEGRIQYHWDLYCTWAYCETLFLSSLRKHSQLPPRQRPNYTVECTHREKEILSKCICELHSVFKYYYTSEKDRKMCAVDNSDSNMSLSGEAIDYCTDLFAFNL